LFKEIVDLSNNEQLDFEKIKSLKEQMHWGSLITGNPYDQWEREVTQNKSE